MFDLSNVKTKLVCVWTADGLDLWLCDEAVFRTAGQRLSEAAPPRWPGGPV